MTEEPSVSTGPPSSEQIPESAEAAHTTGAEEGFGIDRREYTVPSALREYAQRLRGGDLGALPAVLGLAVLWTLFTALRPETFPTPINVANLLVQAAPITLLAMGLVFVLLLGEIDLSAGVTGGLCATIMAVMLASTGVPWWATILAALAAALVIGAFTGALVANIGIPSFVVTLALFLAWQGVTLRVIGQGGTIPINQPVIAGIANANLSVAAGWVLCFACVLAYAAVTSRAWWGQRARGLTRQPGVLVAARVVAVGAVLVFGTYVLNLDRALAGTVELRGIPYVVPLIAALLVIWTFVLGRTTYGRRIYAVGGNTEAARRAGINVKLIKISGFLIGSSMAAVSGIVAASRLSSVAPGAGAGNTLLYAVGAAVIGGTSLFGGRGRARNAILGGLVVATINNGLGLLGFAAYLQLLATGAVLLLAAAADALARKRRSAGS